MAGSAAQMKKPNAAPSVAAVIPTYNRAHLLTLALDSVLGQTHPAAEVVVVDDGSTDQTAAVLETYGSRIRYIRQDNSGKATSLNNALRTLISDYVWVMDDDDCALPDALERHIGFLARHPHIDLTYSGVWCFEGNGPPPPLGECLLWQREDIPHDEFFIRAMEHFPANHQTMLVPRRCYRTIGGFDESMKFGEDYDVILRLARRFRAGRLPEPTILLREHEGARGPASMRRSAAERRDGWRLYDKYLFTKLRHELALREYLPRRSVEGPLTNGQTRRALLQRGCIMARHGLFEHALEDLRSATAASLRPEPPTAAERAICGRMMDFNSAVLPLPDQFITAASRLLRRSAPELVRPAMAGLYWSLRREARSGDYFNAARTGTRLARMAIAR